MDMQSPSMEHHQQQNDHDVGETIAVVRALLYETEPPDVSSAVGFIVRMLEAHDNNNHRNHRDHARSRPPHTDDRVGLLVEKIIMRTILGVHPHQQEVNDAAACDDNNDDGMVISREGKEEGGIIERSCSNEWPPLPQEVIDEREILLEVFAYSGRGAVQYAALMVRIVKACFRRWVNRGRAAADRASLWVESACEFVARILRQGFSQVDGRVQLVEREITQEGEDTTVAASMGDGEDNNGSAPPAVSGPSAFYIASAYYSLLQREVLPLLQLLEGLTMDGHSTYHHRKTDGGGGDASSCCSALWSRRAMSVVALILHVMQSNICALQFDSAEFATAVAQYTAASVDTRRRKMMRRPMPSATTAAFPADESTNAFRYKECPLFRIDGELPNGALLSGSNNKSSSGIGAIGVIQRDLARRALAMARVAFIAKTTTEQSGCGAGDVNLVLWLLQYHQELRRWKARCGGGGKRKVVPPPYHDDDGSASGSDTQDDEEEGEEAFTGAESQAELARRGHRAMLSEKTKRAARQQSLLWSDDDDNDKEKTHDDVGIMQSGSCSVGASIPSDAESRMFVQLPPVGLLALIHSSLVVATSPNSKLIDCSTIISPTVLFRNSLPWYARSGLAHDSLSCKAVSLLHIAAVCSQLPKYSVLRSSRDAAVVTTAAPGRSGDDGDSDIGCGGGDDDGNDPSPSKSSHLFYSSKGFKQLFAVGEDLVQTMAMCPSPQHRAFACDVLTMLTQRLAEAPRVKFQKALIELTPHSSVATLLLLQLKQDMVSEYEALSKFELAVLCRALKRQRQQQTDVGGSGASASALCTDDDVAAAAKCGAFLESPSSFFPSHVISESMVEFLCGVAGRWAALTEIHGEALASLLNVLRTLIFTDLSFAASLSMAVVGSGGGNECAAPSAEPRHQRCGFLFNFDNDGKIVRCSDPSAARAKSTRAVCELVAGLVKCRTEGRFGPSAANPGVAFSVALGLEGLERFLAA